MEFPCGLSEADCAAVIRCESADLQKEATDGRAGSVKDWCQEGSFHKLVFTNLNYLGFLCYASENVMLVFLFHASSIME